MSEIRLLKRRLEVVINQADHCLAELILSVKNMKPETYLEAKQFEYFKSAIALELFIANLCRKLAEMRVKMDSVGIYELELRKVAKTLQQNKSVLAFANMQQHSFYRRSNVEISQIKDSKYAPIWGFITFNSL